MSNIILTKRIGRTTYKVNAHFNQNATETMEEKFLRVISHHVGLSMMCYKIS